ncbi:GntR family transcriptional regulator [Alkalihalobacillus trypoxylicola]|uniref:GntR family transcriptional regulator n=1 Tax=Alkalihalobacillus trypoxylicola TaxID=519424 RepID=A0A162D5V4_9BACI|nr:GntR family transcriptional regulator [Alkalihalobacillus trypoxylicola]KYG28226.1 GntR family transcriptional regulator [Alkalihalobacillus trypoxylicola]
MLISLDFESKDAIYSQIVKQVMIGIAKRELHPNDPLPSVRSLAADIGVNLHTVNKAYQQLKQEGYILIHRQKGVVIHPEGVPKADHEYKETLKQTLRPIVAEGLCKDLSHESLAALYQEVLNEFQEEENE